MAAESASVCQGTKPTRGEPHRYHTVTSPEPRRSTSGPGLEVLWRGSGEAPAGLRGDYSGAAPNKAPNKDWFSRLSGAILLANTYATGRDGQPSGPTIRPVLRPPASLVGRSPGP